VYVSTASGSPSGSSSGSTPQGDPASRPSRRAFSPEYKLAILAEYEQAPNGQKGAILRREGLYSSHVIEWARARDAGALTGPTAGGDPGDAKPSGPAKKTAEQIELERLRRQNAKLQSELNKTRIALDIMGKAHALLEEISESADIETPPTK
jgi:transposase-like protein